LDLVGFGIREVRIGIGVWVEIRNSVAEKVEVGVMIRVVIMVRVKVSVRVGVRFRIRVYHTRV